MKVKSIKRCYKYLLIPLDLLIYPCTYCMRWKCWETRRYFQYDLSIQCYGIFQTLIAALWAAAFRTSVLKATHEDPNKYLSFLIGYVIFSHLLCDIVLILVQKSSYFNQKMSFFIGTLGHISAFGYKELATIILYDHFSSSLYSALSFLCICLGFSIISIYALSIIRKYFCFTAS